MSKPVPETIQRWHQMLKSRDFSQLDTLLADDVVFHSPVVWTPQRGKSIAKQYLLGAGQVLGNEHFRYVREIYGSNDCVLEFKTQIDNVIIEGVDLIQWNDEGQITDFKVMVRPLKAINILHQKMAELLALFGTKNRADGQ